MTYVSFTDPTMAYNHEAIWMPSSLRAGLWYVSTWKNQVRDRTYHAAQDDFGNLVEVEL